MTENTQARRTTEVMRNLDDPLRIFGVLSVQGFMVLAFIFAGLGVLRPVLRLAFGGKAFLVQLALTGLAAVVLYALERHADEHYVLSAIRYFRERPWRVLYGAAHPDPYRPHRLEWVFRAR